jgi:hypothetical protein
MAPNYQRAEEMPLTLPIDSSCLHCNASNVQAALPDARNHYRSAPFETSGITCERCHGDASQHLAQSGKGPILNPGELAASRLLPACNRLNWRTRTSTWTIAVDHSGNGSPG